MNLLSRFSALSAAAAAAAAALLSPARAEAAGGDFDVQQNLIITGERLFGYTYNSTKGPNDSKDVDSNFSLLVPSGGGGGATAYTGPSVGIHYPVIPQLTIGAQLGLLYAGGSTKQGDVSKDKDSTLAFYLAPRVGYVLGINPGAYIWLRGGVSYFNASTGDGDDEFTRSGFGVTLDPMFVLTPVNHFGITLGPTVDLPLSGSYKQGDTSVDYTTTQFGLQFGILGYL